MVRETRHLWVGNLPEAINKERIAEHFKRYGPVQSVRILPPKDGDSSGVAAAVAFMDIKSACKVNLTEHKLDERLLITDFYDPTSGQTGSGSCPPAPEDKGGGPGGGSDLTSGLSSGGRGKGASTPKLDHGRSSHVYYRGGGTPQDKYDRDSYNNRGPNNRYQEDFRNRARQPYRNGPFNPDG